VGFKKLLEAAKNYAVKNSAKSIVLKTARDNAGVRNLYESLGYQRDAAFFSYVLKL
jgi:ribosomal protein S18 acetylase RimI-like enzyme